MHSWSCDHMYKIWPLTEELPPRHDVVLQAGADEWPGVLHISWAGNKYLTRPLYHQFFHSFLKLLKRILVQKLLLAFQSQPDFHQGQTAALPCRVQSVPPPTLSWFYVNSNLLQPVTHPRNFLVIPSRHPCYLSSLSHFLRYLTRPACTQWPTCSWSQRRKAATPASIVALPGMRSLISIFDYFSLLLSLRVCTGKNRSEAT